MLDLHRDKADLPTKLSTGVVDDLKKCLRIGGLANNLIYYMRNVLQMRAFRIFAAPLKRLTCPFFGEPMIQKTAAGTNLFTK
jgi:hypothetical protein